MASVADIERFLERLFERSTASLFRTRVQVVQLEHRVERSMERSRTTNGSRTSVPGRYRVRLNPAISTASPRDRTRPSRSPVTLPTPHSPSPGPMPTTCRRGPRS